MSLWRPLTNAVLSALLAPPCAACARVLEHPLDGAVCDSCWRSIRAGRLETCRGCAAIARGSAIGEYDGALREIIHALKYDGRRSVAAPLARLMAEHGGDTLTGAALAVPVPLHRARQRERGFNQAEDLARGLGLPLMAALTRVKRTQPQVDLSAEARLANVDGAFLVNPSCTPAGRVIVLVDDVTTTGATLDACARVLKAAGAHEVRALTAAVAFQRV